MKFGSNYEGESDLGEHVKYLVADVCDVELSIEFLEKAKEAAWWTYRLSGKQCWSISA